MRGLSSVEGVLNVQIAQRIAHIYSTGLPQAVELVRLNLQGVLAGEVRSDNNSYSGNLIVSS